MPQRLILWCRASLAFDRGQRGFVPSAGDLCARRDGAGLGVQRPSAGLVHQTTAARGAAAVGRRDRARARADAGPRPLATRRSLLRFGRNEFFSGETARDLRGFRALGACSPLSLGLLAPTLAVLALTAGNPPGRRILAFSASPEQLIGLLVAAMFWIVGGVLLRGAEIADENRQFV